MIAVLLVAFLLISLVGSIPFDPTIKNTLCIIIAVCGLAFALLHCFGVVAVPPCFLGGPR